MALSKCELDQAQPLAHSSPTALPLAPSTVTSLSAWSPRSPPAIKAQRIETLQAVIAGTELRGRLRLGERCPHGIWLD